jgi:competence protein ComEC
LPARRAAALATLPMPCLYGILGSDPTAGRAMAVGLTVALAGALGRRGTHPLHLFSLGLISLLCFAPREAERPALAWSLAALAGIGALAGPVLAAIGKRASRDAWARPRSELLRVLTIGAAAFAATAPLQLAQNSHLPWLGVFLTPLGLALALPTTFLAQSGALASSRVLLSAALHPAELLARLATAAARVGGMHWPVSATVAIGVGMLWTLALAAIVRRRPGAAALLTALGVALASCPPVLRALDRAAAPRLRLTFLSVGHGDSMVLETPHGLALLIDAGGSVVGDFDPGREIVVPFLESRGIRNLAAVVLTHPHPDHANGLPAVLRGFEVGELWESGEPCPLPACAQIAALEQTGGTRHLPLGVGRFVRNLDGVELTLRSPRLPGGYDPGLGPNDNSLVFSLTYGKFTALLTGDIEATAEERLVESGTDLSAFLLKAPHHGSDTSSTQAFVDRVHPRAVIFSVGPRNRFNFPRPEVCERYERIGARSYRTDRDGAVTVETDGAQVWIESAAAREPRFSTRL